MILRPLKNCILLGAVFASLLFLGCSASTHYVGYIENPERRFGFVSKKTEKSAKHIETQLMQALVEGDHFTLRTLMTKKLYDKIGSDSVKVLANILTERNKTKGKYFITHNQLNLKRSFFDEGSEADGFDYYDYIMVRYIVEGFHEAYVYLFLTQKETYYKLCGIRIQDLEYSEGGQRLDIAWLEL